MKGHEQEGRLEGSNRGRRGGADVWWIRLKLEYMSRSSGYMVAGSSEKSVRPILAKGGMPFSSMGGGGQAGITVIGFTGFRSRRGWAGVARG